LRSERDTPGEIGFNALLTEFAGTIRTSIATGFSKMCFGDTPDSLGISAISSSSNLRLNIF
jgi:hypothetical protein